MERMILILNDQGGQVMFITEEITGTLRAQTGGHPPLVLLEVERNELSGNDGNAKR